MEKDLGQIKFTKLDDGLRIEMTGEKFKDLGECCLPFLGGRMMACCSTGAGEECCSPKEEKK